MIWFIYFDIRIFYLNKTFRSGTNSARNLLIYMLKDIMMSRINIVISHKNQLFNMPEVPLYLEMLFQQFSKNTLQSP